MARPRMANWSGNFLDDFAFNHSWFVVSTPLKNMSSSVGDGEIPNIWKVTKIHGSSHHQPDSNLKTQSMVPVIPPRLLR